MGEQRRIERFLVHPSEEELARSSQKEKPTLSIVLPAHNEAETIRDVIMDYYSEIATRIPSRLIIAEDGSSDQTPEVLDKLANKIPIVLYSERKRKGYANAVHDALEKCKEDWVFFSDSDGQYSAADFWRLWRNRHGNDMVIGRKIHRNEDLHRIILSKGFHTIVNALFGLNLHDGDSGFRLIKRRLLRSIIDQTSILKYSFWAEFTIRALLNGYRISEVSISHAKRTKGATRIYAPKKIPLIILKQIRGLTDLYVKTRKRTEESSPHMLYDYSPISHTTRSKYQTQLLEKNEETVA